MNEKIKKDALKYLEGQISKIQREICTMQLFGEYIPDYHNELNEQLGLPARELSEKNRIAEAKVTEMQTKIAEYEHAIKMLQEGKRVPHKILMEKLKQ